ncbi:integrase core domain-containing protein [Periweissella beninensis]|uniref:Integrase core domain-containing protein n=1 Tax=Periweissella beninensis TaxID=504936 RepID=A0ABT0VEY5_9LACO|nr:integrase core domain-containing protein [Periweissella beninensis]MCM2436401.1 integrase core domain-containing protein [Periweissella beninensis]
MSKYPNTFLKRHKIDHSYSKLGYPYDNAKIESFHFLLKRKMIYQFRFPSIAAFG